MTEYEKIKVAFFLPTLHAGGTERNVVNLCNGMDKKIYQVLLVLGAMEGEFIKDINSDISMVSVGAEHSLPLFFALVRYFKTQPPDIFICAFPRINIICLVARIFSKTKTKIIITEHSVFSMLPVIAKTFWRRAFARVFMPALANIFYQKADAIVCVSRGIAQDLANIINGSQKISVIYNPVIDEKMHKLAQIPVTHPWFSNENMPIIVAAGRLVVCKDYPVLLEAFQQVLKKYPARLVILGNGPEKEHLQDLVYKMGLTENVAFFGFVKNPFQYIKRAQVFVSSSLQEGFGNAIIEAMACATPVVSTDCPTGPGEIITNGKDGILVPVGDSKSMSEAIITLLENPALAQAICREAQVRAEFFSVRKSVQEYEKVCRLLIS